MGRFGNGGSNSGHRVSRKDEKQQRRDEVNGDQHKTGELKKPSVRLMNLTAVKRKTAIAIY